jgi:hypothetical protein
MPTDRPVMAPLLCRDCEHKLTEHGEDYTMSVINRFDTFRLLEIINSAKRYRQERDERAYFGADLPVNRDALAYFALSVIWRGAVKVWTKHGGNHTGGLRLDKQDQEGIRQYLLGDEPFPSRAAVKVTVATDFGSQNSALYPWQHQDLPSFKTFQFYTLGVFFEIAVGQVSHAVRNQCCIRSPYKLIFSGNCENASTDVLGGFMQTAKIARKLK